MKDLNAKIDMDVSELVEKINRLKGLLEEVNALIGTINKLNITIQVESKA